MNGLGKKRLVELFFGSSTSLPLLATAILAQSTAVVIDGDSVEQWRSASEGLFATLITNCFL
jgi:hypothetical protein